MGGLGELGSFSTSFKTCVPQENKNRLNLARCSSRDLNYGTFYNRTVLVFNSNPYYTRVLISTKEKDAVIKIYLMTQKLNVKDNRLNKLLIQEYDFDVEVTNTLTFVSINFDFKIV